MIGSTPCGIAIPQFVAGGALDLQHIRVFLERAETLCYESAWTQEAVLSNFGILEPLSLLSHASALTSRMRLGVSVMLTTLRNPGRFRKATRPEDRCGNSRLFYQSKDCWFYANKSEC